MGKKKLDIAQTGITFQTCFVVKEWAYEVLEEIYPVKEQAREIFHHAVIVFSRIFIESPQSFKIKVTSSSVQMYGLLSIKMAIKHLEKTLPYVPSSKELYSFCLDAYTEDEYCIGELDLEKLNPFKNVKDIMALDRIKSFFLTDGQNEKQKVKDLALVLCDSYVLYFHIIRQPANHLAATCISFSKKLFGEEEWDSSLFKNFCANKDKLDQFKDELVQFKKEMYQVALDLHRLIQKKKKLIIVCLNQK